MSKISYRLLLDKIYTEWRLTEADCQMLDELGQDAILHIVAIHSTLIQLFAHNPVLAALWPTTPNKALNGLTPIDVIQSQGMEGLEHVRQYLVLKR